MARGRLPEVLSAMRERFSTSYRDVGAPVRCAFLLAATALVLLSCGCFVIRGERRLKPDADGLVVKVSRQDSESVYYRVLDSADFKLKVGVAHGPARWELQFLLNILPIYVDRINETTWPLLAYMDLEPKSPEVAFDPRQVFFQGTNQARLAPAKIWQNDTFLGTSSAQRLLVTNRSTFLLEFSVPHQSYLDQDSPFRLLVEGVTVSGELASLPPVHFEPTTVVRPGFRLPY